MSQDQCLHITCPKCNKVKFHALVSAEQQRNIRSWVDYLRRPDIQCRAQDAMCIKHPDESYSLDVLGHAEDVLGSKYGKRNWYAVATTPFEIGVLGIPHKHSLGNREEGGANKSSKKDLDLFAFVSLSDWAAGQLGLDDNPLVVVEEDVGATDETRVIRGTVQKEPSLQRDAKEVKNRTCTQGGCPCFNICQLNDMGVSSGLMAAALENSYLSPGSVYIAPEEGDSGEEDDEEEEVI